MMCKLGEIKRVEMPEASRHQRLYRGSFSKIDYTKFDGTLVAKEWLYCREYFQDESNGIRRMLFCHTSHRCKNIAAFIYSVEDKLDVQEKTIIGPTQRYNISWIKVSPWWTKTSMRRSFFTILLRCGVTYKIKEDNFDHSLFSVIYTRHTEYAVKRFMSGHTKYTGKKKGWYNQFYWGGGNRVDFKTPDKDEVDSLLVLPINKKNSIYN
jgi:hypothetical protein